VTNPQQFHLPDLGEGLTEAEILHWLVQPGDTVEINQVLVEVETAKAAVELPSPYAGVVAALHVQEGQTVDVGHPIIAIAAVSDTESTSGRPEEPDEQQALLVGYGPQTAARRRRRHPLALLAQASRTPLAPTAPALTAADRQAPGHRQPVAAKPPVRKLAKDLGIGLDTVTATGPNGTVTREDIRQAASAGAPAGSDAQPTTPRDPALQQGQGMETRIAVRGVRKHTAAAMVASAFTAPHATEFITLDITATMNLREIVSARREFQGLRVTPLLFVARALLLALHSTPEANSSWDEDAQEIIVKHYVNLGIAAATERGLVVPNIKDAERKSLRELAEAISALTDAARAGKTTPKDMSAGTITITNVGVFGIDTGTPILNPGEAAILAVGAIRRTPWVVTDDAGAEHIEPRWVIQLALSFDHRLIDGQQGSRLLADTADILRNPGLALL
jgi:2-oxoisovalerate dehydrogenase E2 component (dihydrolipoyl transacylase)